jgi:gliding motility associated protien GldN
MKKNSVLLVVLLACLMSNAQHQVNSFFDDRGLINFETQEYNDTTKKIVNINHRVDDVVWSRVVYRIIDLRFKQNYQLYSPLNPDDPTFASLFRTMLNAIQDGMPIYPKSMTPGDFKPYFNVKPFEKKEIPTLLNTDRLGEAVVEDPTAADISKSIYMLLNYDEKTDSWKFNSYSYETFARNTLKYMIQEVVFFDKHYSRMYSKILAIAPMNPDNNPHMNEQTTVMDAVYGQILFWVPFDTFRPYMAKQLLTPSDNDTKGVTYDDFFAKKMYSSYLFGMNNIYDKMIPQLATTYEEMQAEQRRIEAELLTVEQDLWEY